MFILLRKMTQNAFIRRSACKLANYEEAVKTLYSLQSNAAYLQSVIKHKYQNDIEKLKDTEKYLLRSGVTLEQLDKLSIIHVAGTKGKGSTCAFVEAILRKHGFYTGFYSSPHLVTVRERIRINGEPISESDFTYYFWKVYNQLEDEKQYESDMPTYFKFLTILMFNVFLHLNVDVAIIEVGIGGEVDCTNIIRNPVCVGITSLGLDHTFLLGNTLAEIAYQKSGIFKTNTTAFTVPQPNEAIQVLNRRALEKNCNLYIVPPFEKYPWKQVAPILAISGSVQRYNASLAIQLAARWIEFHVTKMNSLINEDNTKKRLHTIKESKIGNDVLPPVSVKFFSSIQQREILEIFTLEKIADALSSCKWPGRTQILKSTYVDIFLDGAHTVESMECCISWFENSIRGSNGKRFLVFNTTGQRNSIQLLMLLRSLNFHKIYFVPNFAGTPNIEDQLNFASIEEQKIKCETHCKIWGNGSIIANNVTEVLNDIKHHCFTETNSNIKEKSKLLVTGSLHLVGCVLAILDPNFTMTTKF